MNAQNTTEYNGWKNWATWNVALWIGNDEYLYHAAVELANKAKTTKARRVTSRTARRFILDHLPEGTADMRPLPGRQYRGVDFAAIANAINEFSS